MWMKFKRNKTQFASEVHAITFLTTDDTLDIERFRVPGDISMRKGFVLGFRTPPTNHPSIEEIKKNLASGDS